MGKKTDQPYHSFRTCHSNELGLTLLEVLLSLVITGVLVSLVLNLYISQYRQIQVSKGHTETDYALLRAGQVLVTAIKSGNPVQWDPRKQRLTVSYEFQGLLVKDSYYLADKDYDGVLDLYREHLSAVNPVVSGLRRFEVIQSAPGLWTIHLEAGEGQQVVRWSRKVRQMIWLY